MNENEKLIEKFYTSFKNSDPKGMIECYHEDSPMLYKKRFNFVSILLLLLFFLSQFVLADDSQNNTMQFLVGKYQLIGQKPDSKETYSGTISFSFDEKKKILNFKRVVKGKNTLGTAKIEKALAGDAEVLRLRFVENKKEYEGTFLWRSDLDNYGRLSGYIYLKNNSTKSPGLEAYFIKQE